MQGVYIFPKRKALLTKALLNNKPEHWRQLLKQLLTADKMSKGVQDGDPWAMMQLILAAIAGKQLLTNNYL